VEDISRRPERSLRIIGGRFRGRLLLYSGDRRTRPMKERVREATFNLVGPAASGKHALDLFAGTGALGLEALSRGAARATFIEQHIPTARIIQQNIQTLQLGDRTDVVIAITFLWQRRLRAHLDLDQSPWLVFCSPPYDFYIERWSNMLALLQELFEVSPTGSLFVLEADQRFDFGLVNDLGDWDVRTYAPAVIGVHAVK
jgi:16S rRNA (guanine966-N2)-methyltransferase